ncbi:N-acyl-D-glucosamine 2-epimerase, partial [bacterium]
MLRNNQLISELHGELKNLLGFWSEHAVDEEFGGFAGEVDSSGKMVPAAEKGLVLNARILWSFSVAYNFLKDEKYLELAHRAYQYLINFFWDKENGGLVWAVD